MSKARLQSQVMPATAEAFQEFCKTQAIAAAPALQGANVSRHGTICCRSVRPDILLCICVGAPPAGEMELQVKLVSNIPVTFAIACGTSYRMPAGAASRGAAAHVPQEANVLIMCLLVYSQDCSNDKIQGSSTHHIDHCILHLHTPHTGS